MNHRIRLSFGRLLTLLALVGIAAPFATAQVGTKTTADQVITKFIEATGGEKAYASVKKNIVMKGEIEIGGIGVKGPLVDYSARPDLHKSVVDLEGLGQTVSGSGGGIAWESSLMGGNRLMEGAELTKTLRDGRFQMILHWKELFAKGEVDGSEKIVIKMEGDKKAQERDCWKVVLTPKKGEGEPEVMYFDKESNLMIRQTSVYDSAMGKLDIQTDMTHYKKMGNILFADRITQMVAGQEILVQMTSIETDVDLPEDTFDPPASIQKLIEKAKAKADAKGKNDGR